MACGLAIIAFSHKGMFSDFQGDLEDPWYPGVVVPETQKLKSILFKNKLTYLSDTIKE